MVDDGRPVSEPLAGWPHSPPPSPAPVTTALPAKLESIDDLQPVQADYSRLGSSIGGFSCLPFLPSFSLLTSFFLRSTVGHCTPGWARAETQVSCWAETVRIGRIVSLGQPDGSEGKPRWRW